MSACLHQIGLWARLWEIVALIALSVHCAWPGRDSGLVGRYRGETSNTLGKELTRQGPLGCFFSLFSFSSFLFYSLSFLFFLPSFLY